MPCTAGWSPAAIPQPHMQHCVSRGSSINNKPLRVQLGVSCTQAPPNQVQDLRSTTDAEIRLYRPAC
eukprot:1159014-Pelagomonas_calceolata.AAC.11